MDIKRDFPADFIWGAATAAYQVEGAPLEDGKGPSVWNEFESLPYAMADNADGSRTCDQYHLWKKDIGLMRKLGLKAYRFSISWSRVLPDGRGRINQKGMDYYKMLCDTLRENDIAPYVTLYHWDLPLQLQQNYGGWESLETVKAFGEYAEKIALGLGHRVEHYFTFNEFKACADVAYGMGLIAPGLKLSRKRLNQVRHHLLVAHGLGVQALREAAPHAKVGLAENPVFMIPAVGTKNHIEAAKKAFRQENGHFLTAVMEGAYPEEYLRAEGSDAPVFSDDEMKLIHAPLDFLGLNLYYGKYVREAPDEENGYHVFEEGESRERKSGIADFFYQPSAMYWGCRLVKELWNPREMIISEHGIAGEDRPERDGGVYDPYRIAAMRDYLSSLARGVREGLPITGYFHWSFMDNLEWHLGFRPRFGLYYVNFRTLERIPKMSAEWYSELIRSGVIA